jgi:hypothetical protein
VEHQAVAVAASRLAGADRRSASMGCWDGFMGWVAVLGDGGLWGRALLFMKALSGGSFL